MVCQIGIVETAVVRKQDVGILYCRKIEENVLDGADIEQDRLQPVVSNVHAVTVEVDCAVVGVGESLVDSSEVTRGNFERIVPVVATVEGNWAQSSRIAVGKVYDQHLIAGVGAVDRQTVDHRGRSLEENESVLRSALNADDNIVPRWVQQNLYG